MCDLYSNVHKKIVNSLAQTSKQFLSQVILPYLRMNNKLVNMNLQRLYIILLLMISYSGQSQNEKSFYKHYRGNLDSNMFISCDLISQNGMVSAYYYYYFENPASTDSYLYGKTIPLEGNIIGSEITLREFNNEESRFKGDINPDGNITGTWQKKPTDKAIPFELTEDYSKGSTPLNCFKLDDEHILLQGDEAEKNSPKAKINLFIIYPGNSNGDALRTGMDTIITKFLLNKKQSITSPQKLLEKIRDSYFDSYIKSTEGIENINSSTAFNWEKNTVMDVLYNENHLLSVKFKKYINTGGSQGLMMNKFFVFNTGDNTRIKLKNLFSETSLLAIDEILDTKIRQMNGIMPDEKLSDVGFFIDRIQHTENFFLNNDGIGFFYNVYEIAPYTIGTTELFIPFNEITDLLIQDHPIEWIE